jgi:hypothetical protein
VRATLKLARLTSCLLAVACAQANMRSQTRLASQLKLTVTAPSAIVLGSESRLGLAIQNTSKRVASGCLTNNMQFGCALWRADKGKQRTFVEGMRTVDHPRCATRFTLEPGETLSLGSERSQIADFPTGAATLYCSFEISTGKDCDHLYGCYTATITNKSQVQVLAATKDAP